MYSVVPGVDDSDVSSTTESEKSGSECGDDDGGVSQVCDDTGETSYLNTNSVVDVGNGILFKPHNQCTESAPPSGVSDQHWEKFQSLQQRCSDTRWIKDVISSRNNTRRRRRKRRLKSVQNHKTDNINKSDSHHDYKSITNNKGNNKAASEKLETVSVSSTSPTDSVAPSEQQQEHWHTLQKYLNVNDHMKGLHHGKYAPKSGLEKKLDQAVTESDFDTAEEISDQLATRELACKIAKAANARDYLAEKRKDEERRAANRKKRRKLAWGFEPKERWQMKGNM